jgi:hypothetical protein
MERSTKKIRIVLSSVMILAFLAVTFSVNAQAGKVNFSGSWAFNAEKSNLGQAQGQGQGQGQGNRGGFGGGNFTAKQDAGLLTVERTRNDQTVTSKYTLDGKESINTTGMGDSKSKASWSADGKVLTIATTATFERDGQSMTTNTKEEWSLTDANTLSIKSTRTTPNGERVTTRVYDKK